MPSIVTVLVVSKRFFFDLLPRKWLGENDSLFGLAHIFSKEIYATTNNKGKNPFFHIYEIQIELIAFVLIAMFVAVSLLRRVIIILWDAPPPPSNRKTTRAGIHFRLRAQWKNPNLSCHLPVLQWWREAPFGSTRTCRKHPETIDVSGSTNIAGWKMEHEWRCLSYWKWGYSSQDDPWESE